MSYAILVAGGTGGHINSAIALGEKFEEHGLQIEYISGKRHLDFKLYCDKKCRHIFSYPLVGKNPSLVIKSLVFNSFTFFMFFFKFLLNRPRFVFGAGGYVCGPTLLAAYILRVPIFILEQNAVMGLTNRILSNFAKIIFTGFNSVKGLGMSKKIKNYGNPLRKEFFLSEKKKEPKKDDCFQILVFGGSLGSQEINNVMTCLLEHYQLDIKVSILHQTGKNKVLVSSRHKKIIYQQVEYLDEIIQEYKRSNLIICRGGASTISELRAVQKPAIIIPITFHSDQHQVRNANSLKSEVSFPVYIEKMADLTESKCAKLQDIIEKEYSLNRHQRGQKEVPLRDSCSLIVKEVLQTIIL